MLKVLAILAGLLLTLGASWSIGKILLDRLRLRFHPMEELFFRFVLGSACFSLLIFCLNAAFLARTWVFLIAGLVPMALAARSKNGGVPPPPLPELARAWKIAFAVVFATYGVFYFVNAMAPEASPDGSTYHLGLVARYLRQHGFGRVTTNMYANLPEALEMLFLPAFSIGKHSAAALVEFAFFAALPLGMLSYGRRFNFPIAGVVGALLPFTSPVFGITGTSAYNDVAGACVVFASFYLLQIWVATRNAGLIPLVGLLTGFAFGIKYTLFLPALYAGFTLIWRLWRARQPVVKPFLVFSAGALAMIAPWLARNWIVVANPVSPFLNRVFPNPFVTIWFEHEYIDLMRNGLHLTTLQWIQEASWKGGRTGGFLGPVFLIAPLALLAIRWSAGRQLLLAGGLFFLPALANTEARFLMPCIPFFSLAIGIVVAQIPVAAWTLMAAAAVLGWPTIYPKYCDEYAWRLRDFPVKAALRKIPEAKTLEERLPDVAYARMIDRWVPRDGRVLSFTTPPEAYLSRAVVVGYESAFGNTLTDLFQVPINPDFQPTRVLTFSFPPQELRRVRVVQTAGEGDDRWSVAEFRVYRGSTEVPRAPQWHLSAKPNPWDVSYAFDNNPTTRWVSQQSIYPGMEIAVDFSGPQTIDRVVIECSHDQWKTRLKLQGAGADGVWKDLGGEPEATNSQETDWSLRRAAVLAAKERGITHLLVTAGDYGSEDYFKNRREWGLELVGAALSARLYRLK